MRTPVKKGRKLKRISAWFSSAGFFITLLFALFVVFPFELIVLYIRSRFKK